MKRTLAFLVVMVVVLMAGSICFGEELISTKEVVKVYSETFRAVDTVQKTLKSGDKQEKFNSSDKVIEYLNSRGWTVGLSMMETESLIFEDSNGEIFSYPQYYWTIFDKSSKLEITYRGPGEFQTIEKFSIQDENGEIIEFAYKSTFIKQNSVWKIISLEKEGTTN